MSVQHRINKLKEWQIARGRAANYVVLSELCHSTLRREIRGVEYVLEHPDALNERITEYMGMKVIVLDRDDIFMEVG